MLELRLHFSNLYNNGRCPKSCPQMRSHTHRTLNLAPKCFVVHFSHWLMNLKTKEMQYKELNRQPKYLLNPLCIPAAATLHGDEGQWTWNVKNRSTKGGDVGSGCGCWGNKVWVFGRRWWWVFGRRGNGVLERTMVVRERSEWSQVLERTRSWRCGATKFWV